MIIGKGFNKEYIQYQQNEHKRKPIDQFHKSHSAFVPCPTTLQIPNSLLYQQPPVPVGWGYYDTVNLTTQLNYKLNYTWQITVHDIQYNIKQYVHTNTKRAYLYEYYLVCGSISAAGGVAQPKVWINNLLITRCD